MNVHKLPKGPKRTLPKAPASLSKPGRDWWDRLTLEYSIEDPGGLLLLETTLCALDRLTQARETLAAEGIVVTGPHGKSQPHPCIAIERDSRAAVLAGLKALNLDLEPLHAGPGRPPGAH
jgi:phage terminase small subunit